MIILLLLICIGACILTYIQDNDFGVVLSVTSAIVCISVIIVMLANYPYNIEARMALYEEENAKIEEKIKTTIQLYMDYEKETYNNLVKNADLTTLLITYPELNSNELVKAEVDMYIKNSTQIKVLKEEQITKRVFNWWLYLGR